MLHVPVNDWKEQGHRPHQHLWIDVGCPFQQQELAGAALGRHVVTSKVIGGQVCAFLSCIDRKSSEISETIEAFLQPRQREKLCLAARKL